MKRVTNGCSGATSSRLVSSWEPSMLEALTGEAQLLGSRQAACVTAPYSQRLGLCDHQSSRDRATQTTMLVSGAGGRHDLRQGQSALEGRLKPKECIPCRPIGTPGPPAEAAKSTEAAVETAVYSLYQVQGTCELLVGAETKLSPGAP